MYVVSSNFSWPYINIENPSTHDNCLSRTRSKVTILTEIAHYSPVLWESIFSIFQPKIWHDPRGGGMFVNILTFNTNSRAFKTYCLNENFNWTLVIVVNCIRPVKWMEKVSKSCYLPSVIQYIYIGPNCLALFIQFFFFF